jgi:hypothetical protein
MFAKLGSYMDLFRKGSEVANVEKWKSHQITGTMVAGVLIALMNLAKVYGYELPIGITTDDLNQLAVGVIAVANIMLTCTTSKRAGLLSAKPDVSVGSDVLGQSPEAMPIEVPRAEVADEPTVVQTIDQTTIEAAERSVKDIYIG